MSGDATSWPRQLLSHLSRPWRRYLFNRAYRTALDSDGWSAERIRRYHDEMLVKLVRHAAKHVPFYQRRFAQAGIDVEAFRGAVDLPKLPIVSREELKEHAREMCVRNTPSWMLTTVHTGGTTSGVVATTYAPRAISDIEYGYICALWKRVGARRTDCMAMLRGEILRDECDWRFQPRQNRLVLSSYKLRAPLVREFIDLMKRYKVQWLHAYPSSAWVMATLMKRHNIKFDVPLRGALFGSESLYEWQYETFREVFQCPIYTHYGHRELAVLGGWCEKTTDYHFLPTHGYVEFVPMPQFAACPDEPMTEIVATGYLNWRMPLIRYATMDYARPPEEGACPACGRHHTRTRTIYGRAQALLVAADGTVVPHTNLGIHSYAFAKRYQFVQDAPGEVVFKFIPSDPSQAAAAVAQLEQDFAGLRDWGLTVRAEVVEDLPRTWTGKDIFVVRNIPLPWESDAAGSITPESELS